MNIYDYPLTLLKELEKFYKQVRDIVVENDELIKITRDEPFKIVVEGKYSNSFFSFLHPILTQDQKKEITISVRPKSPNDVSQATYTLPIDAVLGIFSNWIYLLKSYSALQLSPPDNILKEYENEFYEELHIMDEDADIKPFKLPQQVFIYKYLEHVESILMNEELKGNSYVDIQQEITSLKEQLPSLTKNETIKKISILLAKTRKKGLNIISKVWDEAVKEIVKKGVTYAIDNHELIIQKLHSYFIPH